MFSHDPAKLTLQSYEFNWSPPGICIDADGSSKEYAGFLGNFEYKFPNIFQTYPI